ncbi:hypothetical protein Hanom_Chr06g00541111 [Helianthus anomalus]
MRDIGQLSSLIVSVNKKVRNPSLARNFHSLMWNHNSHHRWLVKRHYASQL